MAVFSVGGIATGIDTQTLIAKLMDIERNPEVILQRKQSKIRSQVDIFKKLNDSLGQLQKLAQGIKTSSTFKGIKSSVVDSTVATATASSTASPGTHTVQVVALARSQRQVSTGYASSTSLVFNTGSFSIDDGAGTIKTVNVAEGQNSLDGISAAINASGANVTASVINDGSGSPYRLVLTGKDTKNYTVDFSNLTTLPSGGTGSLVPTLLGPADPSYQAGTPATAVIDGVTITKTSNTITDVISGVTVNLLKEGATTDVKLENDTDAARKKIDDIVAQYNDVITIINLQSVYDPKTKKAGVLSGDSTLRTVQSRLQSLTTTVSGSSGNYKTLADLGITSNKKDGTLSVDSAKLTDALSNRFDDVVDFFTHNGDTYGLPDSQYGMSQQLNSMIENLVHAYEGPTSTSNGIISIRTKGLNDTIGDIDQQISSMEIRLAKKEESLRSQFTAMEQLVSNLQGQGNTLLSYLSKLS